MGEGEGRNNRRGRKGLELSLNRKINAVPCEEKNRNGPAKQNETRFAMQNETVGHDSRSKAEEKINYFQS